MVKPRFARSLPESTFFTINELVLFKSRVQHPPNKSLMCVIEGTINADNDLCWQELCFVMNQQ